MNDQIKINNKSVQLVQPYEAPINELIGRTKELRKILAAWIGGNGGMPLSPLLLGEPGIGKNRIVYECARMCMKKLYIFQGHEDITAEDLVCAIRFSDDPDKKMDYIVSPVVTAMITGNICFIDEIAKIRPRALAPLASLLDERRYIDSTLLGERVYAHSGFRLIAATNTADLHGDFLPDFIRSRMRPVINIGYPGQDEIDCMVESRYNASRSNATELLEIYWALWREKNGAVPPTPRDTIYIFGFALKLADFERFGEGGYCLLESHDDASLINEKHIREAFDAFNDTIMGRDK
jgi:MoxR-like ATPase